MKKLLLSVFSLCLLTIGLQAQSTFYSESFEDTLGWKLNYQFDDGNEDYALRDSVSKINSRSKGPDFQIIGADSNFVLAFEDINSGDPGSAPSNGEIVLTLDSIPINGYDSLELIIAAAANPTSNRYDNAKNWFGSNGNGDTVSVWGKIDGGNYVKLMYFCAADSNAGKTSTSNTGPLYFDKNQNYIGGEAGETALNDTLSDFKAKISGKGMYLSIKVELRVEAGDEEVILDNFRITGVSAAPVCVVPSGMTVAQISPTSVGLIWTSPASLSNIEYDTAGFTLGTGMKLNNVTSPRTITSLIPNKQYDFYYQDTCSSIGTSKWIGPVKFITRSAPQVTRIWRTMGSNIMVAYSDSMNTAFATSTNRYKGIVGLSTVTLNSAMDTATLTYSSAFANGVKNTLTVDSVLNTKNVLMDSIYTYSFVYNNSKPNLVINEIMYNDPSGPDTLEYLEILNNGSSSATLGGLSFGQGVTHEFAAGTNLAAGSYLILAKNSANVLATFSVASTQWQGGGLSNGGEDVLIWNSNMDTIDYVNYDDGSGWPTDPDGNGYSLVLCDASTDNNTGSNWGTEPAVFGTSGMYVSPGAINTCRPPFVPPLNTIASLRTFGADGRIDSNRVKCAIEGIVVTDNMSEAGASGPDVSFVIVDEINSTGLTAISFDDTSVINYSPHLGDSIRIYGTVSQFNGLAQFAIDSVKKYASMVKIPAPFRTDTMGELTESRFIEMIQVTVIDPSQWPALGSDANVDIMNQNGDTLSMRVDQHTDVASMWANAPTGKFQLKGVGGQYDGSSPYLSGYQIFPRFYTDIDTTPLPPCVAPIALKSANVTVSSADISWTSNGSMWNVGWSLNHTSTAADIVDSVMGVTANPYTVTGLNPNQHYHVYVQEVCGAQHSKWSDPVMVTTLATGIDNLEGNKTSFVAFPNPNNIGEVRFNMEVTVTVRNILGQTVKSAKEVASLDISDLESGVYLIQSEEGDTIRFIVE